MRERKFCIDCNKNKEILIIHDFCDECGTELSLLLKHMYDYTGKKITINELRNLMRKFS